ncbi:hypothetical protein [Paenibacillus paeoniae]|uniref:Nucleotidyl transferase AbiEii/AbiGii toxin family protein n=1 Tax=Paenibacillus paeoniae TaxID=2292705 RepID=A0A371PM94_9BACL|nr:hypothetical protein [Paenibacillus paeoniae]REK77263.1 hypothetical protein DX130_09750 [Paenibacillus paeoniae]
MIMETTSVHEALSTIVRLAGHSSWVLGGSSALLLRGLPLDAPPRDIDLYCDDDDASVIHNALIDYAIDEPAFSETDIYRSTLSHYRIGPIHVELVGGFRVRSMDCCYKVNVKELLLPYGDAIELHERLDGAPVYVRVVPLAHELWFNTLRQREDRVKAITAEMRKQPLAHQPVLAAIAAANDLADEIVIDVHKRILGSQRGDQTWMLK